MTQSIKGTTCCPQTKIYETYTRYCNIGSKEQKKVIGKFTGNKKLTLGLNVLRFEFKFV